MNCKLLKLEEKLEGEAREKIVIAKNLLKAGLSIDVIAESTGLSIEDIQKLTLVANES